VNPAVYTLHLESNYHDSLSLALSLSHPHIHSSVADGLSYIMWLATQDSDPVYPVDHVRLLTSPARVVFACWAYALILRMEALSSSET
jgi:hypothetical protein